MSNVSPAGQNGSSTRRLDLLSVRGILELLNEEEQAVPRAVCSALPQIEAAVEAIAAALETGGRMLYVGAGTSGRMGAMDAAECPPTFGTAPGLIRAVIAGGEQAFFAAVEDAEDNAAAGASDVLRNAGAHDVVVGISASGRTPYVLGAMQQAAAIGAITVGLSCRKDSPLSGKVRFPIEVPVGPEMLEGSTRLKAGSAQKQVLNMLSTAVMIRLGKVYGNLMVNVQANNHKLRERVVSIIQQGAGVGEETARLLSVQSDGDAGVAILMHQYGKDRDAVCQALRSAGGHFGKAGMLLQEGSKNGSE